MANPSNLYAEKIFAEHPIALWTLDNDVRYLSLIADSTRDMSTGWTITNGSAQNIASKETTFPYYKLDTYVSRITKSASTSGTITLASSDTFDSNSDTFTIGFYYFLENPYITTINIGYNNGSDVYSSNIIPGTMYEWNYASATFNAQPTGATIKIKFTASTASTGDYASVLINGLTIGKWAEDFNMVDLGAQKVALPADTSIPAAFSEGIESARYCASDKSAYYIVDNDIVYARSSSFPLVYGSSNSTILTYNDVTSPNPAPSIVFPGYGFLNQAQKYATRTLEAWLKIKAQTTEPKRIIGPLTGADGLYVNGAYFILKIGDNFGSHYVGEWDRPMLIQIVTIENSAKLLVNGETVISLLYSTKDLQLQEYYDGANCQDWIGFYAHSDIPKIEIDCVAMYSYEVDRVLAMKRFVYGMGVDFPDNLVSIHGGNSMIPDYSVANYANNQTYGQSQKNTFLQGKTDNMSILNQVIVPPAYSAPTIVVDPDSGFTTNDLIGEQVYSDYIDLQPSTSWNDVESHIFFPTINPIQDKTKAIYIVATRSEANTTKQILFKIYDPITKNFLEAYTIRAGGQDRIQYNFSYNGTANVLATAVGNVIGTKFGAGIIIDDLITANTTHGTNLSFFFSNQKNLVMYVGGDESFTTNTTFTGKIYKVGIVNARNLTKISSLFTSGRFTGSATTLNSHVATYTMFINYLDASWFLDVSCNMYWQDTIPLSSLAKFSGGQYLLDYLQINMNYPKPITFASSEYNTDASEVRAYLTFQSITSGANTDIKDFANTVRVTNNNTIDAGAEYTTTKYEVVDGTVVYIPTVDISTTSLVAGLEINVESLTLNKFAMKNFQIASQALSLDSANPTQIGTKRGINLIGYGTGINPILINKESSDTHFDLSYKSGIMVTGTNSDTRGYYFDLNKNESSIFDIGLIQTTVRFESEAFSTSDTLIFEVLNGATSKIKFYIDSINTANTRARIFAKDENNAAYNNVEFYINGTKTNYPVITLDDWVTIGIKITEHYDFANVSGKFRICGPMIINNLSYFQLKAGDENNNIVDYQKWINVNYQTSPAEANVWSEYSSSTWGSLITTTVSATEINGLDIKDVYETFTGTSKIIAAYDSTDSRVVTKKYGYVFYTGSESYATVQTPA
jgi:hypothetical protein